MDKTVPDLLFEALERDPDRLSVFWPEGGVYKGMTRAESVLETARIAKGLADLGVGPGTPVAILSETRREWAACDLAILCLGGITIGIYPTLLPEQVAYQLGHAEAKVVIAEDEDQVAKVEAHREELPALEHIVRMDRLDDLRGNADVTWLREQAKRVSPDDVATLIYTSGTTGHPKGAILTHRNFVEVSYATLGLARVEPGDRGLVWLPLAHSLQRFTIYRGLLEDTVAYFAESVHALPEALAAARPQVLAVVPRVLEKIHDRAVTAVEERGPVARAIFDWAFAVGKARLAHLEAKEPVPLLLRVRYRLADRLVFRRVRERLGGELRVLVSGGAALDEEIARWFGALGITVLEGWGLTETCAPATVNTEDDFRFGTVGKAIPGVELRIADDGEVLVKSPGLFRGYYKDEAATEAAFTDGWFHTGDIGELDEDGFLRITDRKKALIVTAGGKNIAPVNVEQRLERSPYVDKAVVIGSERPYLVALLVPDAEALEVLGEREGWPREPLAERVKRPEVQMQFDRAVAEANAGLARFETVKRFAVLSDTFSVEGGELTPTLKLKRRVVDKKYAAEIESLYPTARSPTARAGS